MIHSEHECIDTVSRQPLSKWERYVPTTVRVFLFDRSLQPPLPALLDFPAIPAARLGHAGTGPGAFDFRC